MKVNDKVVIQHMKEIDEAVATAYQSQLLMEEYWKDWLVNVPEYDHDGVQIERFEVSIQKAFADEMRAALNPQRPNRAVQAGTFTRLTVDDVVWMTDTPAECRDLYAVDDVMADVTWDGSASVLIVGLGLGVLLNRAIVHHDLGCIDVVERDQRVIDAVGPHYMDLAEERHIVLNIHRADIHEWRIPKGRNWDVGFFDIWATITDEDMPEVKRLRDRFRNRLGWFGAWAQDERIAQRKRLKTGKWAY